MSDLRDSLGRVGYDLLSRALAMCHGERTTGRLRVSGKPGGVFHLRDGLVVAVESPGAPGPEARLLRSGRVSGEQWAELLRESAGARWPEAGLIARGLAGAAQLRVVCMMAMHDAAFAVVAGRVDGCVPLAASEPFAPVAVGEPPGRLLQEATRKLAAVAALPCPVRPDRERPVPATEIGVLSLQLPSIHGELLAQADGRRTARDIAFATGLGVYTVTVAMARMLGEGLLDLAGQTGTAAQIAVRVPSTGALRHRPPPAPRRVEETPPAPPDPAAPRMDPEVLSALTAAMDAGAGALETAAATTETGAEASTQATFSPDPDSASPLPRREPGASGITETLAPERTGVSWKGFFRLRHRIWTPDSGT